MSEIETYLGQLRSHLTDLDARRADEIVAEARTHLESRAAQLRAGGMSEDEVNAEAVRTFGDSALVAGRLRQGNRHHRRPHSLRALAALAVSLATAFSLAMLLPGVVGSQRDGSLVQAVQSATNLDLSGALYALGAVAFVIGFVPAALLAGFIGGRRHWWLAAVPGVLWACVSVPLVLLYATTRVWLPYALLIPVLASLAFAALGWFGGRLAEKGRGARNVPWLCALYALCLGTVGLQRVWHSLESFAITAVVLQPAALVALALAHRDGRLSRTEFSRLFCGVAAVALLAAGAVALILGIVGGIPVVGDDVYFWLAVACAESILALFGLPVWRLVRPQAEGAAPALEGTSTRGGR